MAITLNSKQIQTHLEGPLKLLTVYLGHDLPNNQPIYWPKHVIEQFRLQTPTTNHYNSDLYIPLKLDSSNVNPRFSIQLPIITKITAILIHDKQVKSNKIRLHYATLWNKL